MRPCSASCPRRFVASAATRGTAVRRTRAPAAAVRRASRCRSAPERRPMLPCHADVDREPAQRAKCAFDRCLHRIELRDPRDTQRRQRQRQQRAEVVGDLDVVGRLRLAPEHGAEREPGKRPHARADDRRKARRQLLLGNGRDAPALGVMSIVPTSAANASDAHADIDALVDVHARGHEHGHDLRARIEQGEPG